MSESFWVRCLFLPLIALSMLLVTGCGGCSDDSDGTKTPAELRKEEEERAKRQPKENFQSQKAVTYPGVFKKPLDKDEIKKLTDAERLLREQKNKTKPGHWVNVQFPVLANNFNANGTFTATSVDGAGNPTRLMGTEFYSYSESPVSIPKGEWKNLETTVYFPKRERNVAQGQVRYEMAGPTGLNQIRNTGIHSYLKTGQFHLVVLSAKPDDYRYLNEVDCVRMPDLYSKASPMRADGFYELVFSNPGDPLPLARSSLAWTTMAYLFWADLSPDDLDPDQQTALIDWLHFGGQLIIDGPSCLDKFRNSFLEPYLPVQYKKSTNLTDEDFKELNQ